MQYSHCIKEPHPVRTKHPKPMESTELIENIYKLCDKWEQKANNYIFAETYNPTSVDVATESTYRECAYNLRKILETMQLKRQQSLDLQELVEIASKYFDCDANNFTKCHDEYSFTIRENLFYVRIECRKFGCLGFIESPDGKTIYLTPNKEHILFDEVCRKIALRTGAMRFTEHEYKRRNGKHQWN